MISACRRGRKRLEFVQENRGLGQVPALVLDVPDDDVAQLLQRVTLPRGQRLDVGQALLVHRLDHVEQQVFLGLDVVVQAALQHSQPVRDVLQRGRVVPLGVEHVGGDLDQLGPALLAGLALAAGPSLRPSWWLPHGPVPSLPVTHGGWVGWPPMAKCPPPYALRSTTPILGTSAGHVVQEYQGQVELVAQVDERGACPPPARRPSGAPRRAVAATRRRARPWWAQWAESFP